MTDGHTDDYVDAHDYVDDYMEMPAPTLFVPALV